LTDLGNRSGARTAPIVAHVVSRDIAFGGNAVRAVRYKNWKKYYTMSQPKVTTRKA